MEAWGWLLAYVAGFGLVQLLLYRYFRREDPSPDAAPGRSDGGHGRPLDGPGDASDEDGIYCPNCGAFNERAQPFAYCRECVERLP